MVFRPWGDLSWLLKKIEKRNYDLIGCLSTEPRCIEAYRILVDQKQIDKSNFLEIIDPINTQDHDLSRKSCRASLEAIDGSIVIENHSLLEPTKQIIDFVNEFIGKSGGHVVFDISACPKRFFFPITKLLVKNDRVKTLIITYTSPAAYYSGNLSDDAQAWSALPLFSPTDVDDEKFDVAVVGVGFIPLGLPDLLKDKQDKMDLKLLFPFPPGPPHYQRTWNFINEMQTEVASKIDTRQIYRVDAKSIPVIFDKIESLVVDGKKALFAPYGPKTMSLAMCLSAIKNNAVVYYTQPTSYHPQYSEGVESCSGYLIKIQGNNLY